MHLVCPVCTTAYMIPHSRIPKKISLATCRECGTKISIEPEAVAELGLLADYPELKDLDPGIFHLGEIFVPTNRETYRKTRIGEFKAKVVTATRGVLARMSRMTGR